MLQKEPSGPTRECSVHPDTAESSSAGNTAEIQMFSNFLFEPNMPMICSRHCSPHSNLLSSMIIAAVINYNDGNDQGKDQVM